MNQLIQAVRITINHQLQVPSLILIYSGIDVAGWLGAEKPNMKVQESFVSWVENFMFPIGQSSCSATDLYSARCAILHTLTPDSRLSKLGKARRIAYAWGSSTIEDLDLAIRKSGYPGLVVLHVDDLLEAFEGAWRNFIDFQKDDKTRAPLFEERSKKMYVPISSNEINDYLEKE